MDASEYISKVTFFALFDHGPLSDGACAVNLAFITAQINPAFQKSSCGCFSGKHIFRDRILRAVDASEYISLLALVTRLQACRTSIQTSQPLTAIPSNRMVDSIETDDRMMF